MSKCLCEEKENMLHIYTCKYLNSEDPEENYEMLLSGSLKQQKSVLKRFEQHMKKRDEESETNEFDHVISCDPPIVIFGNG